MGYTSRKIVNADVEDEPTTNPTEGDKHTEDQTDGNIHTPSEFEHMVSHQ